MASSRLSFWLRSLLAAPRRLLSRRFAREVMTLQMGSFATMGLQFITSIIIANLLNPAPFGVYYQARALLDLVAMLANLAVGQALITRLAAAYTKGDRDECLRLLGYFLKVGLVVSLVEAGVGLLGGSVLGAVVLNDPDIGEMARILFITPPLLVAYNLVLLALQSTRQVKRLALLENGALMLGSLLESWGWWPLEAGSLGYSTLWPSLQSSLPAPLCCCTDPRFPEWLACRPLGRLCAPRRLWLSAGTSPSALW